MKLLILLITMFFFKISFAQEIITIYSPYSPSHSGTPAMLRILEKANNSQNNFNFRLEFKPGGEQILAIKEMDKSPENSLAIIAPKYVEHTVSGKLDRKNYVPVHALGDACWAVISNLGDESLGLSSLKGNSEIVVGGVGFGNAAHLTGLQLGEKFDFKVRYIVFKSNFDALLLMASNGSINLVLERPVNYENLKTKSPNLKLLGLSCPTNDNRYPNIKTIKEQGVITPFVFNITVSNKAMTENKRNEISKILNEATISIGKEEIKRLSDMIPPIFSNIDIGDYYQNTVSLLERLISHHRESISKSIKK